MNGNQTTIGKVLILMALLAVSVGLAACGSGGREGGGGGTATLGTARITVVATGEASPVGQPSPAAQARATEAASRTASPIAQTPTPKPSPTVELTRTPEAAPYEGVAAGASRIDSALYLGQLIWECPGGDCSKEAGAQPVLTGIEDARKWVGASCYGDLMTIETDREYLYLVLPTQCELILSMLVPLFPAGEEVYIEAVPITYGPATGLSAAARTLTVGRGFGPSEGWYLPK